MFGVPLEGPAQVFCDNRGQEYECTRVRVDEET